MRYVRVIVTAHDDYWRQAAAVEATGYASSIIGCDAEAGIERWLAPERNARRPTGCRLSWRSASPRRAWAKRSSLARANA